MLLRKSRRLIQVLSVAGMLFASLGSSHAAEEPVLIPAPAVDEEPGNGTTSVAVLAGGCFWGVQAVFQHVEGVLQAVSGYAGGSEDSATYETVSSGKTGHAEAVRIVYDPARVSFGQLLQIYYSVVHDPTQLNRQGPDHGPQYRSTIFPMNESQRRIAESYIAQLDLAGVFPNPIVTTIESDKRFYPAEAYHQDFLVRNPNNAYIVVNDIPKVEALKEFFPQQWREQARLVMGSTRLVAP